MAKDISRWKFDVSQINLNDIVLLEDLADGVWGGGRLKQFRDDLLPRLLVGRSKDEIGKVKLNELPQIADSLSEAIKEASQPPKNKSSA